MSDTSFEKKLTPLFDFKKVCGRPGKGMSLSSSTCHMTKLFWYWFVLSLGETAWAINKGVD